MKILLIIFIIMCMSCEKKVKIFEAANPKKDFADEYKLSPERVEDIILSLNKNKKKFGEAFGAYLLYGRYHLELMKGPTSRIDMKLYDLYIHQSPIDRKIIGEPVNDLEAYPVRSFVNFLLSKSKIILLYDKPCTASDKADASASVSSFKVGADLCFSLSELSKVNKHTIDREVLGIIAHEFTHLLGFGESDAVLMQNQFLDSYNVISDKKDIATALSSKINRIAMSIQESVRTLAYYNNSQNRYTTGEASQFCVNEIQSKNIMTSNIKFLESLHGKNNKMSFVLSRYYNFSIKEFIKIIDAYKDILVSLERIDGEVCQKNKDSLTEDQRKILLNISRNTFEQFQKINNLFEIH